MPDVEEEKGAAPRRSISGSLEEGEEGYLTGVVTWNQRRVGRLYELEAGLISKAAGVVVIVVGIVEGVGGAICCCCCCWPVGEACGRRVRMMSGVDGVWGAVKVEWVCWTLKHIEGEGAAQRQHISRPHEGWQECCRLGLGAALCGVVGPGGSAVGLHEFENGLDVGGRRRSRCGHGRGWGGRLRCRGRCRHATRHPWY